MHGGFISRSSSRLRFVIGCGRGAFKATGRPFRERSAVCFFARAALEDLGLLRWLVECCSASCGVSRGLTLADDLRRILIALRRIELDQSLHLINLAPSKSNRER